MDDNTVTILGARGSMSVSGAEYLRYGGATTCVLVRLSGQWALIDAGTGLMNPPPDLLDAPSLPLLLTHAHADHLLGLPLCPYVMRRGARLEVYAARRGGLDAEAQIRRFLSPPLWPGGTVFGRRRARRVPGSGRNPRGVDGGRAPGGRFAPPAGRRRKERGFHDRLHADCRVAPRRA